MLLKITDYKEIDERKLMDIYSQSNFDNTLFFYPDEPDKQEAVRKVEEDYLHYIQQDFLGSDTGTYWVLEEDGVWVSALRTYKIKDGLYFLEALETRPDCRREGCGVRLLQNLLENLKEEGPFRLCDCVDKENIASIKTHEKCGFKIVSEEGYDYLQDEKDSRDYGMEYSFK